MKHLKAVSVVKASSGLDSITGLFEDAWATVSSLLKKQG